MADPSTQINYTFEEIQRYLQGKMSPAEMHAIEKAALQDPFLADAIEGYKEADINTARQHLNQVYAGLYTEKKKSKIASFNNKARWLNVAAILIIITGIGIFGAYFLNRPARQDQVAQVKKVSPDSLVSKDAATGNIQAPPVKKDSIITVAQNKNRKSSKARMKNEAVLANKSLQADTEKATVAAINTPSPVQQNEDDTRFASAPLSAQKNDSIQGSMRGFVNEIPTAAKTFAGKVTDANARPVAGVVIASADKKTITLSDLNGNFILQGNDSLVNVTASAVGYDAKDTDLLSGNNNTIIINANSSALNEVVVVGYATKAKTTGKIAAVPVGGWENFNHYVLNQLNKDSTLENGLSEKDLVELEFLIDKTGKPYDIKITKPLDEQHNAKAIEILKSGPKWTGAGKNKKTRVAISF